MENLPEMLRTSGAIEIRKRLKRILGGRILDVATGSGDFINTLMLMLKNYNFFIGIDIVRDDLKSAKKQLESQPVEFIMANAEYLNFKDEVFDTVCISYSFHHLKNVKRVLAEMKRVLKPHGYFIVQEEYSDGEQSEAQKTDILRHHWKSKIDSQLGIFHNKLFSRQKIKGLVKSLQLSELETFESAYSVRCLICDRKFECDPTSGKGDLTADQFSKEIDANLRRLKGYTEPEMIVRLKKEGERLKQRMRKHGFATASYLFFIGKK